MMAHPIALALALMLFAGAGAAALAGAPDMSARVPMIGGAAIIATLFIERLVAGILAARRFGDRAALLFPIWHLARDFAWVVAIARVDDAAPVVHSQSAGAQHGAEGRLAGAAGLQRRRLSAGPEGPASCP